MGFPLWCSGTSDSGSNDETRGALPSGGLRVVPASAPDDASPDVTQDRLLEALRGASEDVARVALETFFRAHVQRFVAFAYGYVRDMAAARDLVQDAFVALWDRRRGISVRTSLVEYLLRTIRNRALNLRRHERIAERWHDAEALAAPVARNEGEYRVRADEVTRAVYEAIATLPPRTREIFLLQREDELTPAEIARLLNVAPQTVYNQLARAVRAVTDHLRALDLP